MIIPNKGTTAEEYYRQISRGRKLHRVEAEYLAILYMRKFGLRGWKLGISPESEFEIDGRSHRVGGGCNPGEKVIWIASWSVEYLSPAQVRDTILHEIAHALVPDDNDHGPRWAEKARELGMKRDKLSEKTLDRIFFREIREMRDRI